MKFPLWLDLECADTSALWNWATCRPVGKRRHVAALQIKTPPKFPPAMTILSAQETGGANFCFPAILQNRNAGHCPASWGKNCCFEPSKARRSNRLFHPINEGRHGH